MHELGWIMIWFRFGSLICAAPLRAPKWYKRKAGVSFGFGGKLVSFHSSDGSAGSSEVGVPGVVLLWSVLRDLIVSFPAVQVFVHNLVTEHNLLSSSSEFDAAMQSGERSLLRLLCDKKSQESEYVFFFYEGLSLSLWIDMDRIILYPNPIQLRIYRIRSDLWIRWI